MKKVEFESSLWRLISWNAYLTICLNFCESTDTARQLSSKSVDIMWSKHFDCAQGKALLLPSSGDEQRFLQTEETFCQKSDWWYVSKRGDTGMVKIYELQWKTWLLAVCRRSWGHTSGLALQMIHILKVSPISTNNWLQKIETRHFKSLSLL